MHRRLLLGPRVLFVPRTPLLQGEKVHSPHGSYMCHSERVRVGVRMGNTYPFPSGEVLSSSPLPFLAFLWVELVTMYMGGPKCYSTLH
jgi:hypothetical protein